MITFYRAEHKQSCHSFFKADGQVFSYKPAKAFPLPALLIKGLKCFISKDQ